MTLLRWLDGETLDKISLRDADRVALGAMTARLSAALRDILPTPRRYGYDAALMPALISAVVEARAAATIPTAHADVITAALGEISRRTDELDARETPAVVHADLSKSNIVMCGGTPAPIDFGLCGYAHPMMDVAGLLCAFNDKSERLLILRGCENAGLRCEMRYIEAYFTLAVILFIACQHKRAAEWDWFADKLDGWSRDLFAPLAEGRSLDLV